MLSKLYDGVFNSLRDGIYFVDTERKITFWNKGAERITGFAAEEVLKIVANTLVGSTRSVDCAARWGGEEFLLVLPGVTEELFRALLERIRMLVETSVYRSPEHTLSVTISIGGVLATKEDTTPSLIKQADQLLYQAKEQGRNRVMVG